MVAAMFIAMSVVVPRLVTQGRRQKEDELAWRGEQYVRAVRLYYRKFGRFPRTVEDFSKNPGNLHFLRKEYKDPMNEEDGTWRYIYVGPGGQLIGSLTRKTPLGMIALGGTSAPNPFGTPAGGANPPTGPAPAQSSAFGQPLALNPPQSAQAADASAASQNPDPNADPSALPPAPQAPKQGDANSSTNDSTVFGGQIVGVASKVNRKSIRFYKGYGKYREWEFIWDPAEDAMAAGAASQPGLFPSAPGAQPNTTAPLTTQPIVTPPQPQ